MIAFYQKLKAITSKRLQKLHAKHILRVVLAVPRGQVQTTLLGADMDLKVSENGEEEAMDDKQKKNFNGEQESIRLKRNDGITNNEIKKSEKIKIQSVSLDNFFY
uniref:Uncharacterized protein n=1 Tax=Lactuca sativa TaxID=4236 RepID=A0A9R1XLB9_LACSA|nr:hypothetical protein LSAT_V11C300109500 [Lactuca sativa]